MAPAAMTKIRPFVPRECRPVFQTVTLAFKGANVRVRILGSRMNPKRRKRVAILGFEGAMALDIVGPFDAFSVAAVSSNVTKPQTCYEVVVLGLTKAPFSTESGLIFEPHGSIDEDTSIDTLIVPGGVGLRVPGVQAAVATWIKGIARKVRRIATVCTGVYGVAPTGLLDGHTVTTHWKHAKDLAEKF